jgi:hypothetical protein
MFNTDLKQNEVDKVLGKTLGIVPRVNLSQTLSQLLQNAPQ